MHAECLHPDASTARAHAFRVLGAESREGASFVLMEDGDQWGWIDCDGGQARRAWEARTPEGALEAVQAELSLWTLGVPMSPALRERLVSECDPDRLDDDMRQGRSDSLLHLAWLRS
jgi:hypothetical protein